MHTYKIHSSTIPSLLVLMQHPATENSVRSGYRLVLLMNKALTEEELLRVNVADHVASDRFASWSSWATSNILNELHDEFLRRKKLPTNGEARKQVEKWVSVSERVTELEQALSEAKKAEEAASRKLVTFFGKTPVQIGKDLYDPCYVREHVYYRRRLS